MLPTSLLSLLPAAATGVGLAVDALSPAARAERKNYRDLLKRARSNQLGLSTAEKNQALGEMSADISASNRALTSEAARQFASGQAPTAAEAQNLQMLRSLQQKNLGAARLGLEQQSQEVAAQQRAELKQMQDARRERTLAAASSLASAIVPAAGAIVSELQAGVPTTTYSPEGEDDVANSLKGMFSAKRKKGITTP